MDNQQPTKQEREGSERPAPDTYIVIGKRLIVILVVVLLGLLVINQYMSFKFKSTYIINPCQLCKDFNANQSKCITGCFIESKNLYPNGLGGWYDPSIKNTSYNISITNIK